MYLPPSVVARKDKGVLQNLSGCAVKPWQVHPFQNAHNLQGPAFAAYYALRTALMHAQVARDGAHYALSPLSWPARVCLHPRDAPFYALRALTWGDADLHLVVLNLKHGGPALEESLLHQSGELSFEVMYQACSYVPQEWKHRALRLCV